LCWWSTSACRHFALPLAASPPAAHPVVGNYRRKLLGANQPAEFFNPANEKGEAARREIAKIAFEDMVSALLGGVRTSYHAHAWGVQRAIVVVVCS
jgi:hypothetical protein